MGASGSAVPPCHLLLPGISISLPSPGPAVLPPPASRSYCAPADSRILAGGSFDSRTLVGQVAVINFRGTWCGPCVKELPELQLFWETSASAEDPSPTASG